MVFTGGKGSVFGETDMCVNQLRPPMGSCRRAWRAGGRADLTNQPHLLTSNQQFCGAVCINVFIYFFQKQEQCFLEMACVSISSL